MTSSTDTRNEAFAHVPNLETRKGEVLSVIGALGPISDRSIAAVMSRPINTITPRRGELVKDGLVREAGTEIDADTHAEVTLWERVR